MNKHYRTVLTTDPHAALEWQNGREIIANNPRDAACLSLQLAPGTGRERVAFRSGSLVRAWVWEENCPKHPTGAPICVHGIDLRAGEKHD